MKYTYQRRRLGNIHYKYLLADVLSFLWNKYYLEKLYTFNLIKKRIYFSLNEFVVVDT